MLELETFIDDLPLVFLDVETTGLDPALGDRVCEVALLRCVGADVVDSYQQLVNPTRRMSPGAYAVHGISDEMLADAPLFPQIADDLIALLDGAVFVGHNAPFDWSFVAWCYAAEGMDNPFGYKALDTKALATGELNIHWFDSNKGIIAHRLGLPAEDMGQKHRADYDAWYQAVILKGLLEHAAARRDT